MSVDLLVTHAPERAFATLPRRAARRLADWRAAAGAPIRPGHERGLLIATAVLGVMAFVLGVGNRFTRGPLFIYIPDVDLIPPLGKAAWQHAFVIHQQNPLFALCGGYQVGGMESLTVYQMLYMWEWMRVGSVALLAVGALLLVALAVRDAVRRNGIALAGLVAMVGCGVVYGLLRYFADHAGLFAMLNTGQHRHAVDVTFASLALAGLLAAAAWTPRQDGEAWWWRAAWALPIALDIAFGALFEAMDAGAVWSTFPGYTGALLPAADRLFAFDPVWRNLTENVYLIQACHRVLSFALWIAAFAAMLVGWLRGRRYQRAALLFVLLTLEGASGAATLMLGLPVVPSIAHQFIAVLVLAAALSPRGPWHRVAGVAAGRDRVATSPTP